MPDILIHLRAQAKLAKKQGHAETALFLTEAADELEQARFLLKLAELRLGDRNAPRETMVNGHD